MVVEIRALGFDDVSPLWHKAWPDNPANVKPVNTATFMFTYGINGYDSRIPFGEIHFYGAFVEGLLVGVNSCYKSTPTYWMRTRGLYVEPEFRGNGIGGQLIDHGLALASEYKCSYLWGYPRCTSWPLWKSKGFKATGKITTFDYGPHVWAYATVK